MSMHKGYHLTRARMRDLTDHLITRWERNVECCIALHRSGEALPRPAGCSAFMVAELVSTLAARPGYEWLDGGLLREDRERIADAANRRIHHLLRAGGKGLRFVHQYAAIVAEEQ